VVIGALFLTHSAAGAFNLHDLRLARGLARWAGIVLENAELFRESQEASELLRRANEDKDEFLAMVSHELRTPITTIFGGSRLLRQRRPLLNEEAVEDMINAVADEAEQLYHLVEDLLAMARTESSGPVEREPVAISQLLRQVADQSMRGRDRQVTLTIAEDFPPVLADPTYIAQIVGNLLSNANKYTPDGLPIDVEASHDGQHAAISVSDHGPGVPEDEMEQIFERFFRSAQASSSVSGKGLGLTVCKRLVEAMQGQIEAQNRPQGGLRVTFTLELAAELAADDEGAPTAMKGEAAQQDHLSLSSAAPSHESGPRRDLP
jgi:signal transduction histidine kinase